MNFLCYDTEDNSKDLGAKMRSGAKGVSMFDKKVTQIAAITAEGKHFYNKGNVKQFLKWLSQQEEKYVYALNMQYDLGNLFANHLDAVDCSGVKSRMIRAILGEKIFADVFNIWFQGVKSLGKVFGLEKLETDSMAEDKEYVFRDVEIIRKAMLFVWEFAAKMGLDEVPATLGSLGLNLWRHWGGETVHDSREISKDARFGGRVELFATRNTSEHVGYTDINSLYPAMMLKEFPGAMEDTGTELRRFGVAKVTVKVPKDDICPLPYRDERGRILFGYGEFTGTWTIAELREAEKTGTKILKVHNSVGTDEGIWPYRTYMDRIYKIRLDSKNNAEKELYKRLMNCLYGRTGTTGEIWRTVAKTARSAGKGIPYGSRVLATYTMPLGEEVNWSHCAYITSYGRIELMKHLRLIGAEKLIYCDTDCAIFNAPDKQFPFPVGDKLGEMKIEKMCNVCKQAWHPRESPCPNSEPQEFWEGITAFAPKMYKLGEGYKAKGVPKALQKEFIEKGHVEYDMPYKFREAVRFYDRGNIHKLSVWHTVEKNIISNYDKKIAKDGRFFPCDISEF